MINKYSQFVKHMIYKQLFATYSPCHPVYGVQVGTDLPIRAVPTPCHPKISKGFPSHLVKWPHAELYSRFSGRFPELNHISEALFLLRVVKIC